MANTSDKLDNIDVAEESIDEILSSIKDVITSAAAPDSVLVLTEQVEEDLEEASANDHPSHQHKAEPANDKRQEPSPTISDTAKDIPKGPDILDQLDAGAGPLGGHARSFPEEKVADVTFSKESTKKLVHDMQPDVTLVREDVALATQAAISHMLNAGTDGPKAAVDIPVSASNKSFEDVAIALLRSELQSWLHENLEGMVKSIVENEIKRIMPK